MTEQATYQANDEININGTMVIITKQGFRSPRYSWYSPALMEGGEVSYATAEEAVAHAYRTFAKGECRHGNIQFCISCHDAQR